METSQFLSDRSVAVSNPYASLSESAFWRPAVADRHPLQIENLWYSKFSFHPSNRIVTSGSCFAQHIGRFLSGRDFGWIDSEPAPRFLSPKKRLEFSYGVFSFRTGNIYTAQALRQWVYWAFEVEPCPKEVWISNNRYFDPFRPQIEPQGFSSMSELLDSRAATLRAIRKTLESADRFVFTLGLTESWRNKETGVTYAMCPGTLAGDYDSRLHEFHNTAYPEVEETLRETFDLLRAHNDGMRFLLTVSPVPLTATASSNHVLVASTYSKSVLRAVAGDLAMCREDTDYFPSYEIMSSPPFRGMFYEPNMRSIAKEGVDFVMGVFLKGVASDPMNRRPAKARDTRESPIQCSDTLSNEVVCEDQLLEAFGRRP